MERKKVAREQAIEEVNRWLDFKRVKDSKREDNKQFIENIVDAVEYGDLTIDENCVMEYILSAPVKFETGEVVVDKLTIYPRIKVIDVNKALRGIKNDDADGRILGYVSALTNTAKGKLASMYTEDYSVLQSIVMFFL